MINHSPVLRNKKCKVCRQTFTPRRSIQPCCGYKCEVVATERALAKKAEKAAREDRKITRAKLEAIKTVPMLKKEAQHAFNAYCRARDKAAGYSCICCGRPLQWDSGRGGEVDAGHYRSTGSADHLRFSLDNCHAQRSDCNRFGAGRAVDYRKGLVARIGLDRVEALEANNQSVKWTRDGLRAIRDKYRAKARALAVAESTT